MSVEVVLESPLANALNAAIPPKLVEVGWSQGGDDSALSEYIILMLVNGKTQEQIAAELSGDLLNLGPDDPGARDFSQWLFRQVEEFNQQLNGGGGGYQGAEPGLSQMETPHQDADMGDVSDAGDGNVPTGPKSMRNGNSKPTRDKRMFGHLAKAMDRSNESVLHRVRPQSGNERINSHARPPTGPRQQGAGRGAPRTINPRGNAGMGAMNMAQGPAGASIMNMNPQQQLDLYAMLEQQSRLMAQMLGPQQQMPMGRGGGPMGNGMGRGFHQQQQQGGRSLFDRVQPNAQRPAHNAFRKGPHNSAFGGQPPSESASSSAMDVEMSGEKKEIDPEKTTCNWNLSCTNKDCKFAHQSPAAPPGTAIDYDDVCSFGAACKNRKCTAKHPSPAQKVAHQTSTECRYGALCTNTQCPFAHPSMPACRNGADCTTPNCKFTHTKTECKFNPCLKANCPFKHADGQKRGKFDDKVWTADGGNKEHVSERKFVDENGPEELIVPGAAETAAAPELVA